MARGTPTEPATLRVCTQRPARMERSGGYRTAMAIPTTLYLLVAVYSVGHAHYCSNIGGFPDTSDDSKLRPAWYRALAVSKKAAGTVAKNGQTSAKTYTNFQGNPAPALLQLVSEHIRWNIYGDEPGRVVGGCRNHVYIAIGGEFPKVNDTPQQGLARMAIPSAAPRKVGPRGVQCPSRSPRNNPVEVLS